MKDSKLYLITCGLMFFCPWIWRLGKENSGLAILLVIGCLVIVKIRTQGLILISVLLIILQLVNTSKQNLFYLDNDQQRVQEMRMREYPPVKISVAGKTVWIPASNWLEKRRETVGGMRIADNFFQLVDPGYYFWANYPRQRVGEAEFEKFPFVFLPVWLMGIAVWIEDKQKRKGLWILLGQVVITSWWGENRQLGPIGILPIMTSIIGAGLIRMGNIVKSYVKTN
jgi:hypothetical protein